MGSTKRATAIARARQYELNRFAEYVMLAIQAGQWTGGRTCTVEACNAIAGPRAGALELLVGMDAGAILSTLSANSSARLRRAIPWDFTGDPQAYMSGRYLRLEAGWPDGLARTMIRLRDISHKPERGDSWVAGESEQGAVLRPHLDDKSPHWLFAGQTGAGKSVALTNAVIQLCQFQENTLVLIDGKYGENLKRLERLPGVVGPCAVELSEARAAMAWAVAQMKRRYQDGADGRVVVVLDEIQELVQDGVIVDLMRKITAQGRGAGVHFICSTQHPTVDAFGDASIRRNLAGKLAMKVGDPDASRVSVGGNTPRADYLLGDGDTYLVKPGTQARIQGAYVDQSDVDAAMDKANGRGGAWQFEQWADVDALDVATDQLPASGNGGGGFHADQWSKTEMAAALIGALEGDSRRNLCDRAEDLGAELGSTRGRKLQRFGRELMELMAEYGYTFAGPEPTQAMATA